MKNISLALNSILIIAVAVLYYLHFSNTNQVIEEVEEIQIVEEPVVEVAKIDSKIGYINVDSLQDKYKLYEELSNKLNAREKRYERELSGKSAAFEKKVMDFQKKAPTMTQFEGQTKQKELAKEEQDLYEMRDKFAVKFQNEQIKLNEQLQNKIKDYIKEFNTEKQYNIIIGSSSVGNMVLYFDEGIDISNEVVLGLNERYDVEKAPKEEK
ncbi:MAG: OmpH family outer membrane protein [Flavobacteriales bacterium]|nr:OmpH family outer membrane protein [Flavobacteriales bacterium]